VIKNDFDHYVKRFLVKTKRVLLVCFLNWKLSKISCLSLFFILKLPNILYLSLEKKFILDFCVVCFFKKTLYIRLLGCLSFFLDVLS